MKKNFLKIFFLFLPFIVLSQPKSYELKNINFVGNSAISTAQLSLAIFSKESPNWAYQIMYKITNIGGPATYFDSLLVASDLNAILTLYHSKGYFKVKVKADFILENEAKTAKINFTINEGEPAILKSFKVIGLEFVAADFKDFLVESLVEDTNRVYEESNVSSKNNFALTYLRDNGYMSASAEMPKVIVDTLKNRVDVQFQFQIGKRYRIGEVFVTRSGIGKESVEDELIKDVVDIKSSNIYSSYDIRRGQVRLLRTNLFSSVYINPIVSDTANNRVPLSISTDVGSMNEISPEIKSSNEENIFTLGAGLNYIRKNFFGGARKFTVGGSIFYDLKDARVSVEQPFLFGQPITTKLESYYTVQNKKDNYNATLSGAKLSLDFELPPGVYFNSLNTYFNLERGQYLYQQGYLSGLVSTSLQNSGTPTSIADSLAIVITDPLRNTEFVSNNVILGATFGANKTNDFLYPTSGYSLSFLLEDQNSLAYLYSKISGTEFTKPQSVKIVITSTFYPDFYSSKTSAFGLKFKIGEIITYRGDKAEIPINQRLYAGGNNSVRGWGSRELVPKNQLLNLNNSSQEDMEAVLMKGAASGGFFLVEGSVEKRTKISSKVGTAIFLDYGNTWNDIREFRIDQVAVAAGLGFRYYTDFIPFRIDFAIKAYDPQDPRSLFKKKFWGELFQFQIGIGEAF